MIRKKKNYRKNHFVRTFLRNVFSAFSPLFSATADEFSAAQNGFNGDLKNISADAAPFEAARDSANDSLFLPSSYEEYLPLSEPSSVAVTENYTAIADGLKIYVYDRLAGSYSYYEHSESTDKKSRRCNSMKTARCISPYKACTFTRSPSPRSRRRIRA